MPISRLSALACGALCLSFVVVSSTVAFGAGCGDPPIVTLDIGHTPNRPGAISARGRTEYSFNRALALDLQQALQRRKLDVRIFNEVSNEISLTSRATQLSSIRNGIILSLHHDSVQPIYLERGTVDGKASLLTHHAKGYSIFVSGRAPSFEASKKLAFSLGQSLRQAGFTPSAHHAEPIRGEGRPILDAKLGVFRYDALMVIKAARVPAILFEGGVIANPDNELELENDARRAQMVAALVQGIESFCGLAR